MILMAMTVFSLAGNAQNDAISKYFSKYMDDESFTMVYVSPKMFNLVSKLDIDDMDADVKELLKGIKGLRILTTENDPMAYYHEAVANFGISEYESLMTVRSDNEKVNFLIKSNDDIVEELLLLVGGDEFVMLSFIGNIDLNKISKLAGSMDIDGMEHLEKIETDQK
jgi:hypothetical protein